MPNYDYAFQNYDQTRHVRASLREKQISHKHAREVAKSIMGLSVEKARDYLNDVISKKRAVAFRRYITITLSGTYRLDLEAPTPGAP